MLWRDALVMYDRATDSLWSQVNGTAVAGSERGKRLQEVPSEMTTWGHWKRRHPDTQVLVKPSLTGSMYGDYLTDPERIGVRGSINPDTRLPGKELVIGLEHDGRFAAVPLSLVEQRQRMEVQALGIPLVITPAGAHERTSNAPISSKIIYWAIWAKFHPTTEIIR